MSQLGTPGPPVAAGYAAAVLAMDAGALADLPAATPSPRRRPGFQVVGADDGGVRLVLAVTTADRRPGGTVSGPVPDGAGRQHRLVGHSLADRAGGVGGDHQPAHRLPAANRRWST